MSVLSAQDVRPYTPQALQEQAGAPVFMIKPPTLMERIRYNRDLTELGARMPRREEMLTALRAGVSLIIEPADRPALEALLDAAQSDTLEEGDKASLTELENLMRDHYPPYAKLCAVQGFWFSTAPIMAFRRFVVGWQNAAQPFKRVGDLIPEALLEQFDLNIITEVGWAGLLQSRLSEADAKNSPSPSPLDESPLPSAMPSQVMVEAAGQSPV